MLPSCPISPSPIPLKNRFFHKKTKGDTKNEKKESASLLAGSGIHLDWLPKPIFFHDPCSGIGDNTHPDDSTFHHKPLDTDKLHHDSNTDNTYDAFFFSVRGNHNDNRTKQHK